MSDPLNDHHMRKLLNYERVRKNGQNIAAVRKALVREDPEYANKLVEKFNYSGITTMGELRDLRRKHWHSVLRFAEFCGEGRPPTDHVPAGISLYYLWLYVAGEGGLLRDHMDMFEFIRDERQEQIQAAYDTVRRESVAEGLPAAG